jgi:hypothetical protein
MCAGDGAGVQHSNCVVCDLKESIGAATCCSRCVASFTLCRAALPAVPFRWTCWLETYMVVVTMPL